MQTDAKPKTTLGLRPRPDPSKAAERDRYKPGTSNDPAVPGFAGSVYSLTCISCKLVEPIISGSLMKHLESMNM